MNDIAFSPVKSIDCPTYKDNLTDIVKRLHSVLLGCNTGKHTPYLIARKEVVFPIVNELMTVVSSLPNDMPKSCSDCPLKQRADDVNIADITLHRLLKGDSVITHDEAINLHRLFHEGKLTV